MCMSVLLICTDLWLINNPHDCYVTAAGQEFVRWEQMMSGCFLLDFLLLWTCSHLSAEALSEHIRKRKHFNCPAACHAHTLLRMNEIPHVWKLSHPPTTRRRLDNQRQLLNRTVTHVWICAPRCKHRQIALSDGAYQLISCSLFGSHRKDYLQNESASACGGLHCGLFCIFATGKPLSFLFCSVFIYTCNHIFAVS